MLVNVVGRLGSARLLGRPRRPGRDNPSHPRPRHPVTVVRGSNPGRGHQRGSADRLKTIDQVVPAELGVHLVLDNTSSHETPAVRHWLAPTPAVRPALHAHRHSSINLVERWFSELNTKLLHRGAHRSVRQLTPRSADGSTPGTRTPSRSYGPRPPTRSSTPSNATANESTKHDTSRVRCSGRPPPKGRTAFVWVQTGPKSLRSADTRALTFSSSAERRAPSAERRRAAR